MMGGVRAMGASKTRLQLITGLILALGVAGFSLVYLLTAGQGGGILEQPRPTAGIRVPEQMLELVPPQGEQFRKPLGIAVTGNTILVADTGNDRITLLSSSGKWRGHFGNRGSGNDQFDYPVAVAADGERDRVYVADFNNSRVAVWSLEGNPLGLLPREEDRAQVAVIQPVALAVDGAGRLHVFDISRQRVVVFDAEGKYQRQFGGPGTEEGRFKFANGLAVSPDGGTLYVADTNNGRVQVFSAEGEYRKSFSRAGGKLLVTPRGLALDARRNLLYIADTVTHQVHVFQLKSDRGTAFGTLGAGQGQFSFPNGMAVDDGGRIYITDRDNNRVVVYGYPKR